MAYTNERTPVEGVITTSSASPPSSSSQPTTEMSTPVQPRELPPLPNIPRRAGSRLNRSGSATSRPVLGTPVGLGGGAGAGTGTGPGAGGASGNATASQPPAFNPVTRSASRISTTSVNQTFIDAPGVITALPDLSREGSLASRTTNTGRTGVDRNAVGTGGPKRVSTPRREETSNGDVHRVPTDATFVEQHVNGVGDEKETPSQAAPGKDGNDLNFPRTVTSDTKGSHSPGKAHSEGESEVDQMTAPFPDGGRAAWTNVFGGVVALFCGFGLTAALGGFQTYYAYNMLSEYPTSTIAWIPGTQAFITFGLSAFTGSLFDRHGHRALMLTGTILSGVGLIVLSFCTQYWQLFIVHALMIGTGNNFILISPMGVVSQWFDKKRGLAFGVLMSGASTGSVVWPLMIAQIPQRIGFPWLVRIMGLVTLVLGSVALVLLRTRLPPKPPGPFFYFVAFRRVPYCCVALSSFTYILAFFSFLSFIGVFGTLVGLGDFAPYLLIIANSASAFGRISLGLSADFLGAYNVCTLSTLVVAAMMWAWMGIRDQTGLIIMVVAIGYFSGAYVSLQAPMCAAEATDMRYAGSMVGQVMVFMSFAQLTGAPIFGALLGSGGQPEQLARANRAIAFGASMMTLSAVLLFCGKLGRSRKIWAKV